MLNFLWSRILKPLKASHDNEQLRERVESDLISDEGIVLHEYKDHLGYSTLGVGRLIDERRGGGISMNEALYLLNNDIEKRFSQLREKLPWFDDQPFGVQRALVNMSFQMGIRGLLTFKNTLKLIQKGKYVQAADNALKSKWARQTPNRAKRVTDWIRNA